MSRRKIIYDDESPITIIMVNLSSLYTNCILSFGTRQESDILYRVVLFTVAYRGRHSNTFEYLKNNYASKMSSKV